MKKLVILLFCLVSLHTNAYDFVDNGFRYKITSTSNLTVEVSGHENSKELFDLTIPNEATYSNKKFTVTGIGANSFSGLTNLNKVTIPNTITYIGASAFAYSKLTEINIPRSVKSIGASAFNNSNHLKKSTIEDINTWFEIEFGNTTSNPMYHTHCLMQNGDTIREMIVPEGITEIKENSLRDNKYVTRIVLPNTIKKISGYSICTCDNLESINIPSSVTTIETGAFVGSGLKEIHITDIRSWCSISFGTNYANPLQIAKRLFLNGIEVDNIIYPEELETVNNLSYCESLKSITLTNSASQINTNAFYGCVNLENINFPNSITSIGNNSFYGCSLKKVELPNSVKTIGSNAFANCTKIEYVSCSSATPPVCSGNIFPNDVYLNVSLIVPKGKTDLYKSSNGWNNFLSITEGEDATQPKQCSAPYISLKEGKIHLNSTTPGATYHYTITSLDSNNDKKVSKDGIIPLSGKYIIKAYATADNYITSDITETTIQLPIDTVFSTITEYVERQENPYKKITIRQGDLGSISYHVESQKKYIYQILAEPELSIHSVTYNGVDVTNNLIENSFEAPNLIEDSELVIAYESIYSSISSTSQNKIRVNGFNQKVYISNLNKTDFVQVYDISGKLIESKYPSESEMIISTGNGIFLIKVNEAVIKISL